MNGDPARLGRLAKLVANDVHIVRRTTSMRQVGPEEKAYSLTLSLSLSLSLKVVVVEGSGARSKG